MSRTYSLTNVVANIRHVLQEAEDCERYVFVCWVEFVSARGLGWLRRRVAATSGPFGRFIDLQVLEKVAKTRDTLARSSSAIFRVLWLGFISLSLVMGELADYSGSEGNIFLRSNLVISLQHLQNLCLRASRFQASHRELQWNVDVSGLMLAWMLPSSLRSTDYTRCVPQ